MTSRMCVNSTNNCNEKTNDDFWYRKMSSLKNTNNECMSKGVIITYICVCPVQDL